MPALEMGNHRGCPHTLWEFVSAGFLGCPHITGKLRFARATHRGVQRGEAPLRFLILPQDWGQGG